ncbi:MAG: insulinase family protein, partial [Bacteroidia bacterium]
NPREGQSLDEVKNLILAQIDSVKKGKFDESLLQAIINNEKIGLMKLMENNGSRADMLVDAFTKDISWADYIASLEDMSKVTKADVVAFANKYYGENYSLVYKTVGKDSSIQKVPKPKITPVVVNREKESTFLQAIKKENPAKIEPVYLDYSKDLQKLTLKNKSEIFYKKNEENGLFELNFVFDMGNENDAKMGLALSYLDYLGTSKMTAEAIKTEFYKLGCNYSIGVGGDKMNVALSGLSENFDKALVLLENLLTDPKPDDEALKALVEGILKQRSDAKLDKGTILRMAMVSFAKYGAQSTFTNILKEDELKKIKSSELVAIIKNLLSFQHRILYYGPFDTKTLATSIEKNHKAPATLKPVPAKKVFKELDFAENEVFWVDYDMVQAEMLFLSKSVKYDPKLVPQSALYNEYFGGGMGSLVFQEIRESKALAYAASSRYSNARDKDLSNYDISYIGTQADKLPEAMTAMNILIDSIPESTTLFATAKEGILNNVRTDRITKAGVLADYEYALKMGLTSDIRKDIFSQVEKADYQTVKNFHNQFAKGKTRKVLVIGSKDKLDFKTLEKYGKVKQLNLTEIFGY